MWQSRDRCRRADAIPTRLLEVQWRRSAHGVPPRTGTLKIEELDEWLVRRAVGRGTQRSTFPYPFWTLQPIPDEGRCGRGWCRWYGQKPTSGSTRRKICHATSLSRTTLRRALDEVVAAGVLRRVGDGRRTRYARANTEESAQLTARQKLIMRHVQDVGRITRVACAETTDTSIRTASRDLSQLVQLGRLVPDGRTGNAGGYVLA